MGIRGGPLETGRNGAVAATRVELAHKWLAGLDAPMTLADFVFDGPDDPPPAPPGTL